MLAPLGLPTRALTFVLGVIAGSTDTISFLGLGGLFAAHITGNIVLAAAHIVSGNGAICAHLLSLPVFMVVLGVTSVLADGFEARGRATLQLLLLLQLVLLLGFLGLGVVSGPHANLDTIIPILAGMCGVSAMAVQNALVQIALPGEPATAVMTTNITRLVTDIGVLLVIRDPDETAKARHRIAHTWPAISGFIIGSGLGAIGEDARGLWSVSLPTGLALFVFAMSLVRPTRS